MDTELSDYGPPRNKFLKAFAGKKSPRIISKKLSLSNKYKRTHMRALAGSYKLNDKRLKSEKNSIY